LGGISVAPDLLKSVLVTEAWRDRIVESTGERALFDRFGDFVAAPPPGGLGSTIESIERICREDVQALSALDDTLRRCKKRRRRSPNVKQLSMLSEGDDAGGPVSPSEDASLPAPTGNSRRAGLRRLAKQRPDLHAKVLSGETSVHAALVEAGWRAATFTASTDLDSLEKTLRQRLDARALADLGNRLMAP
jgi:hypothetical protein